MKKKQNIFKFFIKMIFIFLIFLFGQQIFSSIILSSLQNERYGQTALFEIIWAGFVLLLLLLYKNRYIFTEKRESFKSGFKYIIPEVVLSCIFLSIAILLLTTSSMPLNIFSIINLLILCIFIGIVEEFLCRGWLLNEFLERFSNNRKEIMLSILFSSLIFGAIHFLNIGDSQNFIQTLIQVLNATASGIFLALVYYKTKNIWLLVFTHAFWDFSLMLIEHNQLVDCYNTGTLSNKAVILNLLSGIIVIIGYGFLSYWLYRQTDLYKGKNKDKKNILVIIGVGIYLLGLFGPSMIADEADSMECPIYRNKTIDSEISVTYYKYDSYKISVSNSETNNKDMLFDFNDKLDFELYSNKDKNKVIFENINAQKSEVLYDGYYIDYLLIENENSYIIVIQNSYNTLLYGKYLKSDMSNDDSYLKSVKDGLKEYHLPEIISIGIVNVKGNDYNYVGIDTDVDKMIFDIDDILYFAKLK